MWLRRLKRLAGQRGRRDGDVRPLPLTEAGWADAFDSYVRDLAPRDAAFKADAAAYRRALARAEGLCRPRNPRAAGLWCDSPQVADAWRRCAAHAEPGLWAAAAGPPGGAAL